MGSKTLHTQIQHLEGQVKHEIGKIGLGGVIKIYFSDLRDKENPFFIG